MFSFFSKDLYDATEAYAKQYDGVQLALPDQKVLFVLPELKDAVRAGLTETDQPVYRRSEADWLHRLVRASRSGSKSTGFEMVHLVRESVGTMTCDTHAVVRVLVARVRSSRQGDWRCI